jgi:hypothetical protein
MINDTSGCFVVTVCGSSPYLRSLCFGKLSISEAQDKFPAYCGISRNLNSSRTHVHTLGPILNNSEFRKYVLQYALLKDLIEQDSKNLDIIFLFSEEHLMCSL